MAKPISDYTGDPIPGLQDRLIGTDSETDVTYNYKLSTIFNLLDTLYQKEVLAFEYANSSNPLTAANDGVFTADTDIIFSLNQIIINSISYNSEDVTSLMDSLIVTIASNSITFNIINSEDPSNYGSFSATAITKVANTYVIDGSIVGAFFSGSLEDGAVYFTEPNLVVEGITDIVQDITPQLGAVLDENGFGVMIEETIKNVTAGQLLTSRDDTIGGIVYSSSNATAGSDNSGKLGIALETATSGAKKILTRGIYTDTAAFTGGQEYFMGNTAGTITANTTGFADTDIIRSIGYAIDADNLYFNPSGSWITKDGTFVNNVETGTDLSLGTVTATTVDIDPSNGTSVTLLEADTDDAGLLGADKWDEIVANTAKTLEQVRVVDNALSGDIDFNGNNIVDIVGIGFNGAQQVTWNDDFKTIDIPTGTGSTLQVGQEFYFLIYNDTGSQIDNGQIVKPVAGFLVGANVIPTVILAQADVHTTCEGTLFMATSDIAIGATGMATRIGRVSGVDLSTFSIGDDLFLSPTVPGGVTNVRPEFPDYTITIGGVLNNAVSGALAFNITRNVQDTILSAWDGGMREGFDFTVASNGTVITGSLEQKGTGDLTMIFSDGLTTLDCTPQATIALTAGTDTVPQRNYVYIPKSTKVLTVSTSEWATTEHIKIADIFLRSATATQTDGSLANRNWNDHIKATDNNGHLLHIAEKLRQGHAQWDSGAAGTSTVSAATSSDVYASVTAGKVYQLHKQTFPAADSSTGDAIHIVNHPTTSYTEITNLNTQTLDALGATLAGFSFSFVLWGVQNKTGETSHMMLNLPIGHYSKTAPDTAVSDSLNHSVYTIPNDFKGTGFLIARFTYVLQNNGTDWALHDTEDLRGKTPNTTAGGGAGGTGVTEWTQLTDTPSAYTSEAGSIPIVNAGETALEFQYLGSTADTGVALSLTNTNGIYYNMSSANSGTTYTTAASPVLGCFAICLINTTSEPVVTGATKVAGATWVTGTNMYLAVDYNGNREEFYFIEI